MVARRRSWSILIAWGSGGPRAHVPRHGHRRAAGADVAGSAGHALLAGRSDAARQVRQHDPDRDPAARARPAQLDLQGSGWSPRLRGIRQVQVLSPWDRASTVRSLRPEPGAAFVLVNYIRPASRAEAVVPEHRSRDRPHRQGTGAQLPDGRRGDRARDPGSHDGGHRAGRDDRAAGPDPRAAAGVPLAGGRGGAARDGGGDRDGRARAAVAGQLPDADQLAGGRDRRDDEPRARRRLRAADGLARAPGAGRRMGPRAGRRDRLAGQPGARSPRPAERWR